MEFLNKLSPYSVFNYLVPGVVFCITVERIWQINIAGNDIFLAMFVYYLVGMSLSRIGSLVVEPILKKINFVEFSKYEDFLQAEKGDEKLQELLLTANFYRSILGGLVAFLCLNLGFWLVKMGTITQGIFIKVILLTIFVLVLSGYRKQVSFIKKRVEFGRAKNGDS